jgi:hypothetical protein
MLAGIAQASHEQSDGINQLKLHQWPAWTSVTQSNAALASSPPLPATS